MRVKCSRKDVYEGMQEAVNSYHVRQGKDLQNYIKRMSEFGKRNKQDRYTNNVIMIFNDIVLDSDGVSARFEKHGVPCGLYAYMLGILEGDLKPGTLKTAPDGLKQFIRARYIALGGNRTAERNISQELGFDVNFIQRITTDYDISPLVLPSGQSVISFAIHLAMEHRHSTLLISELEKVHDLLIPPKLKYIFKRIILGKSIYKRSGVGRIMDIRERYSIYKKYREFYLSDKWSTKESGLINRIGATKHIACQQGIRDAIVALAVQKSQDFKRKSIDYIYDNDLCNNETYRYSCKGFCFLCPRKPISNSMKQTLKTKYDVTVKQKDLYGP